MDGIPEDFCFDQLPEDFDHFEPILEKLRSTACRCWQRRASTPSSTARRSFTPDDRYYLGEVPELANFWVAAGYNSIGIQSAGGAGMALAQWLDGR